MGGPALPLLKKKLLNSSNHGIYFLEFCCAFELHFGEIDQNYWSFLGVGSCQIILMRDKLRVACLERSCTSNNGSMSNTATLLQIWQYFFHSVKNFATCKSHNRSIISKVVTLIVSKLLSLFSTSLVIRMMYVKLFNIFWMFSFWMVNNNN